VIEALRKTLKTESVERVIYEATRSLALLGNESVFMAVGMKCLAIIDMDDSRVVIGISCR